MNHEQRIKFYNIAYYLIIGLVSVLVMAFVPMIGSKADMDWDLPNTTVGWVVWSVSKICIACVNMLVFHCFQEQAKVNIKDDPKYIEAREILQKATTNKIRQPLSPSEWNAKQYGGKGTTLFLSSILSAVSFGEAILTFDLLVFLSLAFTLTMGIVFGYISMRKAETYWTGEYYEYALMIQEKEKEKTNYGISDRR